MKKHTGRSEGRIRRLREELEEELPGVLDACWAPDAVLDELAYVLWPSVHEGRVATYGALVAPASEPESWEEQTGLNIQHRLARSLSSDATRPFADGMTSWVLRREDGTTELLVFDRLASSERDLVVLAEASGGVLVQRHPNGTVRLAGPFGVARRTPAGWQHQPPVDDWLDALTACQTPEERKVLKRLLRFAVHDLGSRRIGSLLVFRLGDATGSLESPRPTPPALNVGRPVSLAPLQHVLSQIDGATIFDASGTLVGLGVRLVPSRTAEETVPPFGGTRHTNARRFSFDEPKSIVITISEDGPVTVFRAGEMLGRSRNGDGDPTDPADQSLGGQ